MIKRKKLKIILPITILLLFWACHDQESKKNTSTPSPKKVEKSTFRDQVKWIKTLDSAFEQGGKEHKNIIVMVDSRGCRWCIKMEQETFNNPKILKKFKDYIMVKISREDSKSRSRLPEFVHVPIIFFYKFDGELIDNLRGYYTAEDFLAYLDELEEYLE